MIPYDKLNIYQLACFRIFRTVCFSYIHAIDRDLLRKESRKKVQRMSLSHWDKVKYDQYENTKPDRNHVLAEGGRKNINNEPKPEVKPHNEWTPYAGPVMWTGPDGNRDFRPRLFKDWIPLGIGDVSSEKTLSATYISRALDDQPFAKPRRDMIGEIGWFYKNYGHAILPSYPEFMER